MRSSGEGMRRVLLKTAFSSTGRLAMVRSRNTAAEAHPSVRSRGAVPLTDSKKMSAASAGAGSPTVDIPELKPQAAFRIRPVILGGRQRNAERLGGLGHG